MKRFVLFILCISVCASKSFAQFNFSKQSTATKTLLHGIHFANPQLGYACGDTGVILKTIDGGLNWSKLNAGTIQHLWDIKVVPGTTGTQVLSIGDYETILKSNDGGVNWKKLTSPLPSSCFMFGIYAKDSLDIWVTGGEFVCFAGYVMHTTDGGLTWNKMCLLDNAFLEEIVFIDNNNGFACGVDPSGMGGVLYKTNDGGATWQKVMNTPRILTSITAIGDDIYCAGEAGVVIDSKDGGVTWTKSQLQNIHHFYGVHFSDAQHGYLCGGDNNLKGVVIHTEDGGTTWHNAAYQGNWLYATQRIGNSLFVSGDGGEISKAQLTTATHETEPITTLQFYPQPAQDVLYWKSNSQISHWSIYDMMGRLVHNSDQFHEQGQLDVADWMGGVYVSKMVDTKGKVSSELINIMR